MNCHWVEGLGVWRPLTVSDGRDEERSTFDFRTPNDQSENAAQFLERH